MTSLFNKKYILFLLLLAFFLIICGCKTEHRFIKKVSFKGNQIIEVIFAGKVDERWATTISNFSVNENTDPDIFLEIKSVFLKSNKSKLTIQMNEPLNTVNTHTLAIKNIITEGKNIGTALVNVKKLYFGYLISILMGAMLIQNYVFVKYLGLCVYLGVSKKKSTAMGMGVTFTIVTVFATSISWVLYQYVLKPYQLDFLQIIIFIGIVSLTVQGVDTILRKVNPILYKEFGVYLVLVISSCLILAVPLIMAASNYNYLECFMLSSGAGLGFWIALFLMACVRERLELAVIPPSYQGLPIAFIVSGLFALSFMGFSGMSIF